MSKTLTARLPGSLLTTTAIALLIAFPAIGFAQNATPASDAGCVPNITDLSCLPVAPESSRVDLEAPTFSDPTNITNPLFPVNDLHSVLMLGHVDGLQFRTEVTLLPVTQFVDWNGQQIETVVSQYVAYLDGRIVEIFLDFYAQADDGSLWYLGEDVADYEDGEIVSTDGTWRVGRAGVAPAMIMPADPQVGDAFRPENIPGFVFEEVVVSRTDATFAGPHGPVDGAIVVSELHQDGTYSDKLFAPGYGEFRTGHLTELEALALAIPADRISGSIPADLETLTAGVQAVSDAVATGDWAKASDSVAAMTTAWESYRDGNLPPMIEGRFGDVFIELAGSVDAQSQQESQQFAINAARLIFDFRLQYHPVVEIDLARLDLHLQQIPLDVADDNSGGVASEFVAASVTWERVAHTVAPEFATDVESLLVELSDAVDDGDLEQANALATELRDLLADI